MEVSKEPRKTSAIDEVLKRNRDYAEQFSQGGLPGRPPRLRLVVLACLDCRLHLSELLGLELGDAHILRNAGGEAMTNIRRIHAYQDKLREEKRRARETQEHMQDAIKCVLVSSWRRFERRLLRLFDVKTSPLPLPN